MLLPTTDTETNALFEKKDHWPHPNLKTSLTIEMQILQKDRFGDTLCVTEQMHVISLVCYKLSNTKGYQKILFSIAK